MQTTTNLKAPLERVTVTNPIHPLYGKLIAVSGIRGSGQDAEVIIMNLDGAPMLLPIEDTDAAVFPQQVLPVNGSAFLDAQNLLRLANFISVKLTDLG